MHQVTLDSFNIVKIDNETPKTNNQNLDKTVESNDSKINNKQDQNDKQLWFFQLFRFATTFDYILMILGTIAAIAMGIAMPSFSFIMGDMTNSFGQSNDAMVKASKSTMYTFIYVGIGAFGAGWLMFACWMITGQRQAIQCRKSYLKSLLRQQIGWFDMLNQSQLSSKFAKDTYAFQGAIGQKISTLVMTLTTMGAGFVFAFIKGWLMTLVIMATLPALAIAGIIFVKAMSTKQKSQQQLYSKAGGYAQQSLSSIKTVKQLNGQQFQRQRFSAKLQQVTSKTWKLLMFGSFGIGLLMFFMLASYSFGFWYGSRCVMNTNDCPSRVSKQNYTAGDVLVVFFSVIMGGLNLSQVTPTFKKIAEGKQAAVRIYQVIDRQPKIKNPENGIKLQNVKGIIKFQNVSFTYPRDPSRKIFNKINLQFNINKTGLVGQSGCGKSTSLQLIMRFYDPDEGIVTLDGVDIKTLDLVWLRNLIGYVGQQPVLFATSIKENLLFGCQNATQNDLIQALKSAQAYDFVMSLQKKMDTYVGFGGGQLSGGQKQRIAIARAILRKPKIMLLDQATSALDRRNQKLIQKTLQKVTQGITTITVAHRVKTIMNSDMIYVLQKGGVLQKGKFKQIQLFKNNHHQLQQQGDEQQQKKNLKGVVNLQVYDQKTLKLIKQQTRPKTKQQIQKQQQQKITKRYQKSVFGRLFSYSSDKIILFIIGLIISLANGVIFPIFSIFLSKMLTALIMIDVLKNANISFEQYVDDVNFYALMFLILGIIAFFLSFSQSFIFQYVGTTITRKLRQQVYYKMLRMPIRWFDIPKNNAGSLSARLSTDCQTVNSMTTSTVHILVQNFSTLITALIIAFYFEWRTALVALGLLPIMIFAGAIQMKFASGFNQQTDEAYKDSSSLIMQAMINIRTVCSFGYQEIICRKYNSKMDQPFNLAVKKGNISGFFFGISQFTMFLIFGLLFWIGSIFVRDNQSVSIDKMFTAIYAIMFAGMTAGNSSHFMPDSAACKNSAANLFLILDQQDQDQIQTKQNSKFIKNGIEQGDIQISNISFKYDSRNQYVFKNLSLNIKNGTKVAFVGPSGCGKSTIIQLLQRFYQISPADKQKNILQGQIKINGTKLKDFDIHYLRKCFGIVSQQPVLFNGSFKQNIIYNMKDVSMDKIKDCAKKSNALNFIVGKQNSDEGFDRDVGVKGSHISGGQKQRVAIARTLLRNPNKLLLDQATSALDKTNQYQVQKSLDQIMIGKTVISVAHRIQTIKNSDCIYVFQKGQIVQRGTYQQLQKLKGFFYNLQRGSQFT